MQELSKQCVGCLGSSAICTLNMSREGQHLCKAPARQNAATRQPNVAQGAAVGVNVAAQNQPCHFSAGGCRHCSACPTTGRCLCRRGLPGFARQQCSWRRAQQSRRPARRRLCVAAVEGVITCEAGALAVTNGQFKDMSTCVLTEAAQHHRTSGAPHAAW